MKKGSLVKIKKSGNAKLVGTYGLVAEHVRGGYIIIKRFVDGRKDSYHHTSLEVLA
tara:strand:+ start:1140 stop:1307 length:168 start_codon:yes stop_codon:yes gene_type:complete